MKKQLTILASALFFLGVISACSNSDDPAPDAATQVAGTYEITRLQLDSAGVNLYTYTLPVTVGSQSLSGTIVARRDSAAVVYVSFTIKQTGQSDYNDAFGQLSVKGTSTPYDLYYGTSKVGTSDGKVITLDYAYKDNKGTTYREVYSGQKK